MDARSCSRCRQMLPVGARFCRRCGQAQDGDDASRDVPWWRFQSLPSAGYRIDPLLLLAAGTGGMFKTVVQNFASIPGANAAQVGGMIGDAIGAAICCFCGALLFSLFSWWLARRSETAAWAGGVLGVVAVVAFALANGHPVR